VPAGQGEERGHGGEGGGHVDDARVEDLDGHGGDQTDNAFVLGLTAGFQLVVVVLSSSVALLADTVHNTATR
jgi:Co/Zn/Cd efflux system component